jgi:hypothetical protein
MQQHQRCRLKQWLVSLCAQTALLALGGNALAAPILTSVTTGPQSPDPVQPGSNATYVVTVNRTGNGNIDVYLSATGLPAGVSATFSPIPVHFIGAVVTSATAQLVVTTSASTLPGSYPFTIVADDGDSFNIVTNTAVLNVGLGGPGLSSTGTICMTNGSACLTFTTTPGQSCSLQATTNLNNPVWTTLCTTNSGSYNLLTFVDQDAPIYPCRFYRLVAP